MGNPLDEAKKALAGAHAFTKSVTGKDDSAPTHEYSDMPYSAAHTPNLSDEARSAGEGLAARARQTREALDN